MNARLAKRISLFSLLPILALANPSAHGQGSNNNVLPPPPGYNSELKQYNIEIENGQLLLDPLKGRVNVKAVWGSGDIHSVAATIGNLSKYLRAQNPDLNIVLSPGAADEKISDLKLRSGDMKAVTEAVMIATDSKVRGNQLSGKDTWTFVAREKQNQGSTVEVFNLSGYISTLNTNNDDVIFQKLDEVEDLIRRTLEESGYTNGHDISFRYHPGTHLLIVTGTSDAIDITRKIVNALSGQPRPGTVGRQDLLDITNRQKLY